MNERYTGRKIAALATTVAVGGLALTGCSSGYSESKPTGAASPAAAPSSSGNTAANRPYPWPYCDNAPGHRAPAVGFSKDGPVVLVDSNCTNPADPYTGVYDPLGAPSQATGKPAGRIRNGSPVVVLCRRPDGQEIYNDQRVGSTGWDLVEPAKGQNMLLPNGNEVQTAGNEMFLVPKTHLAFFDDTAIGACAMK